jgi:hypothetical protein
MGAFLFSHYGHPFRPWDPRAFVARLILTSSLSGLLFIASKDARPLDLIEFKYRTSR